MHRDSSITKLQASDIRSEPTIAFSMKHRRIILLIAGLLCSMFVCACRKGERGLDHAYVASGVAMQDVVFRSAALKRDMPYRVFLPSHVDAGARLPVVYLLHGGNGNFRIRPNDSVVSSYAANGLILVMPEGEFSYYMNAAEEPADRFEDYIFADLIADVESRFPAAHTREKRAIIRDFDGGFAAIKIAMTRPEAFSFVGALGPSIDITHRRFNIRRWGEYWRVRRIFGPWRRRRAVSRSSDLNPSLRSSEDSRQLSHRRAE